MKKFPFLLLIGSLAIDPFICSDVLQASENCSTSKEFITTLEFLRGRKELAVPENQMIQLSNTVADGCTGAAQRFIRTMEVLTHSGLTANDAIQTSLRVSKSSDELAESFLTVFKMAFLEEYLDLDLSAAMKLALSLSLDFNGDPKSARNDFAKLVSFCVQKNNLDLPRPKCAAFATRLTRLGETWNSGVAGAFIELFEYARSAKGPGLILGQALALAEEVIAEGAGAPENFTQAYRYAISSKGLGLGQNEALAFARKMAKRKLPAANTHSNEGKKEAQLNS